MSKKTFAPVILSECYVLFICEGTAEKVVLNKLLDAGVLNIPQERIIDITRVRSAKKIELNYFNVDYELPVKIVRLLDSLNEKFKSSKLYEGRYSVIDIHTRPEIEMLLILKEGEYEAWKKSNKKPSDYCTENLKMGDIKSTPFLEEYWDVRSIMQVAQLYKEIHAFARGELCLRDLWR